LVHIKGGNYSVKDTWRLLTLEKQLLYHANKRILKSNLKLDIDENYIKSIWPIDNRCPILNEKFVLGEKIISDFSPTLDRIDNNKGYVKDNIRVISAKANAVKNKSTLEELKLMLKNWENIKS